jgi:phosphoserine phosphatase RsbU/P
MNPDSLKLTDFLDLSTLQEIQDSFAAVANVKASITDAEGNTLTQPAPTRDFLSRQSAIAAAQEEVLRRHGPQVEGSEYIAPIVVNNQRLGTLRIASDGTAGGAANPAALQFVSLLANAIARLCFQEYQIRQRLNELTAVYSVTMMLADARDLQAVLNRTVQVICDVMETKAASLRLVNPERDELVIKAAFNLSEQYLNKGPVKLSTADIDRVALSPKGYEYVRNMATDKRVAYPQEAAREGIASMLSVGMRYKGKPIGVLRVYTAAEQSFTPLRIDLMKAMAAQAAAAIENQRLLAESMAAQSLERQVQMAADVQQRMIPQKAPEIPGLDISAVYVPCFELGGDFYDFIPLPNDNIGLAIADVSGKGVPASLIMASVRAALRAQVDNVYYLYEVIRRVNAMCCRDTRVGEFVTLFYGVLDAQAKRLTYCNAGHPPGLLLRGGEIIELKNDNMVLGVSPDESYSQAVIDLVAGDLVLLYTDGLTDAMNFADQVYGRARLVEAFKKAGPTAESVTQNILWDMRRFVGLTNPTDDITMIVVRVK